MDALDRLKFRRQFLFGPRPVTLPGEWQICHPGPGWALMVQHDLPFRHGKTADGAGLILLGFILDPEIPESSDQQIFERLTQTKNWEGLLDATTNLSGRWVIFHIAGGRVRVVNDATALRSVYYSVAGEEPWCFSQPGLYRSVKKLQYSSGAVVFINARKTQKDFEACFPGASSPYTEVAHLLSNHFLDLEARVVTRFWPNKRLEPISLEEGVSESARILRQSMRAITSRGEAAFAITAGRDSRTLLAASRDVSKKLWVHTSMYGELTQTSPDMRVSAEICAIAGMKHNVFQCPKRMSKGFKSVFMNNNDPAHAFWGRICEGVRAAYPGDMICVRGNVSEAARCVFYPTGIHPSHVDADGLVRVCKMPSNDFSRKHFGDWLEDARRATEQWGYKVLDLLFLEHRMSNWLAISQTEYDIVYDTFSPYSNRRLITAFLATPVETRIKPQSVIYKELIRKMWPELLPFPFNPPDTQIAKLLHKARKAQWQLNALLGRRPLHVQLEWRGVNS